LANFREIPAACFFQTQEVVKRLRSSGIVDPLVVGHQGEPVCEVPVAWNRSGVVLKGGLNPVAAAVEAGLEVDNFAMSGTLEYSALRSFP
jgi:repressor of nif and glnA expression